MDQLTLPGGTTLNTGDKVNYRHPVTYDTRIGTIADLHNAGENGWMNVLDTASNKYEWVSLAVQLQHLGEKNILVK